MQCKQQNIVQLFNLTAVPNDGFDLQRTKNPLAETTISPVFRWHQQHTKFDGVHSRNLTRLKFKFQIGQ